MFFWVVVVVVVLVRGVMILDTRAGRRPIGSRIGMNIDSAVSPSAAPGGSTDNDGVRTPSKSRPCPAKGHERRPDKYAGGEMDRETNYNPGSRRGENDRRAIDRNVEVGWIYRNNLDISARIDHVSVGGRSQIAVAICLLPHSLDSVHHVGSLREHRIAQGLC